MRIRRLRRALSACLAIAAWLGAPPARADEAALPRHTFHLEGGYFYGPGPIVPDTHLPRGRLANVRFDARNLRGYCEFTNDGGRSSLLSDGRTRINQNIDAGRLLVGGGTSPILLTAVDGGPHHGTEQYYLDEQYRFVWRVDIALDPGFAEGIIRLDDFVLSTGVVRIGRSLQSLRGEPGGYDQAGSLPAGTFLAGRVGDFDADGMLDGILVAAPHVPLAADMLPGAPVGNRRGFTTDVPLAANVAAELMLRGVMHLREPLHTLLSEGAREAVPPLLLDLRERLQAVRSAADRARSQQLWPQAVPFQRLAAQLAELEERGRALVRASEARTLDRAAAERMFELTTQAIESIARANERSSERLARGAQEPRQKNY